MVRPCRRFAWCIVLVFGGVLGCSPQTPSGGSASVSSAASAGSAGLPAPAGAPSLAGGDSAGHASAMGTGEAGSSGNAGSSGRSSSGGAAGDARAMSAGNSLAGAQAQPTAGGPPMLTAGAGGDAAGAAGGAPAGHSGCAGTAFALCDDFESGTLDSQLWKSVATQGSVTFDSTRGARGSHNSIHVHVDPGNDTMVGLTETKTFPALKAGLSARAFIYIPSADAASLFMGDRHTRLIYAQGASPAGEYALGIWNGGLIQNHYSKSDDSVDTKMLPPFDTWFCLEYELDSATGNVKAYLNDVEITALRHSGWPAANIDSLMFGADRYGSFPVAEELWFDDVVVDRAHIGCDR